MQRLITGFHRDDEGDWAAELDCRHNQHVRHRPPFQERPWVLDEAGRASKIGRPLDCPLCDRAEMPDGLALARSAGPFDADTVPAGLRRDHRVGDGTWGCLRVLEGSVGFSMAVDPPIDIRLAPGEYQPIPPGVIHAVVVDRPVRFVVEFYTAPEGQS